MLIHLNQLNGNCLRWSFNEEPLEEFLAGDNRLDESNRHTQSNVESKYSFVNIISQLKANLNETNVYVIHRNANGLRTSLGLGD